LRVHSAPLKTEHKIRNAALEPIRRIVRKELTRNTIREEISQEYLALPRIDISNASEDLRYYLTLYWGQTTGYGTVAPDVFSDDAELDTALYQLMIAAGISVDDMNNIYTEGVSIYKSRILDPLTDSDIESDDDPNVVWSDPEASLTYGDYISALRALRRVNTSSAVRILTTDDV